MLRNSASIDIISRTPQGQLIGTGDVAQRLLQADFNINALRTNAVLRKDEWKAMDDVLIEIARKRLVAVQMLTDRGLSFPIGNGLGTTILEWEQVSDMDPADVSMSGVTEGERDILDFTPQSMPLPIIHKDFNINIRKLEASRTTGQPLDLAQIAMASTVVSETIETMIFLGHATREGSSRIYGLLTEGNRNTGSVTANWDTPATSGANKLTDVIAMIAAMQDDNMYGPYGLFVTQTAFLNLQDDFKSNSDKTEMARLLEVEELEFIKPSKDVTAGAVVMFQLTRDVIDEVIGLQPTIVQWESQGGMVINFKVMAIMIPRVRSTKTNQSGIAHYS